MIEFQPGDERGEHAATDALALVFRGDVDRPEVEAGDVFEIHGHAADGGAIFGGDEMDVRLLLQHAVEGRPGTGRVAKVFEVKGVVGEAVKRPCSHLGEEFFVPEAKDEPMAFKGERVSERAAAAAEGVDKAAHETTEPAEAYERPGWSTAWRMSAGGVNPFRA